MASFQSMSYWDVVELPVPIRRWLIERHIKDVEKARSNAGQGSSSTEPLNAAQKAKIRSDASRLSNDPFGGPSPFGPTRNT